MRWGIVLVASLAVVGACGRASQDRNGAGGEASAKAATTHTFATAQSFSTAPVRVAGNAASMPGARAFVGGAGGGQPALVPVPTEKKVTRVGYVQLEVGSLEQALGKIRAATGSSGGDIVGETQSRDDNGARKGTVTCRIPAAAFDGVLATIQGYGKVESVNISSADITEQYFNLEIRLRNAQLLEDRLLKLLDKAGSKVSDLLEVEREVGRVRGQIDELEGRKRFWDKQVALSGLTIDLHEPRPAIAGTGGGILDTLGRSVRQTGENFVATLAWLVEASGVAIPAVIVMWLLLRLWKLLRSRRKGAAR